LSASVDSCSGIAAFAGESITYRSNQATVHCPDRMISPLWNLADRHPFATQALEDQND
jgi:hypothetical protein